MKPAVTASGLQRALACPGSLILPSVSEPDTVYSSRGTAIHEFLETVAALVGDGITVEQAREETLANVHPDHQDICTALNLARIPLHLAHEVAFAIDLDTWTARELGRSSDRAYPVTHRWELPGTADFCGVDLARRRGVVGDYKSGYLPIPAPSSNSQLLFLALALAIVHDLDEVDIHIVRLREDGEGWTESATVDVFTLHGFLDELLKLRKRESELRERQGDDPDLVLGTHCRYCPARLRCPANVSMIRALGSGTDPLGAEIVLTPDSARFAALRLKEAKMLVRLVENQIEAYARENPIELGEGMWLGPVRTETERIDAPVAQKVLREKYGLQFADMAIEPKTSKAQIERAVKAAMPGKKVAPQMREILGELRAADGVDTKVTESIKEHRRQAS